MCVVKVPVRDISSIVIQKAYSLKPSKLKQKKKPFQT